MRKNKNYLIPFVGLPVGKHLYEYQIEDSFFEEIPYSEIKKGALKLTLTLNKQSVMLVLHFSMSGTVNLLCDRCNEYFDLEIQSDNELGIKTSGDEIVADDVISISAAETEINIATYIYEYIVLSVPIKRVHPDNKNGASTCNKEAMEAYDKYVRKEKIIDPRWEKLTYLKFNN